MHDYQTLLNESFRGTCSPQPVFSLCGGKSVCIFCEEKQRERIIDGTESKKSTYGVHCTHQFSCLFHDGRRTGIRVITLQLTKYNTTCSNFIEPLYDSTQIYT